MTVQYGGVTTQQVTDYFTAFYKEHDDDYLIALIDEFVGIWKNVKGQDRLLIENYLGTFTRK